MDVETRLFLQRGLDAMERMATAEEELIRLAKDERDVGEKVENLPGPPFCPHCGYFNPRVRGHAEGEGNIVDFVLVADCQECGNTFYAMPEGYEIAGTVEAAQQMREDRKGGNAVREG